MNKKSKIKYDNKIKLLQEYKDSFESNRSNISRKDLLEYILQELKELKKKVGSNDSITLEELLDTFKNIENTNFKN